MVGASRAAWFGVGAGLALLAGGCGSTGTTDGDPAGEGIIVGNGRSLEFDARGAASPAKGRELDDGTRLERVLVAIDAVQLLPGGACGGGGGALHLPGPFVADLVGAGVIGDRPRAELSDTTFCRVDLHFHKAKPGEDVVARAPDLEGASIRIDGVLPDGRAFVVTSSTTLARRLEARAGTFELPADEEHVLLYHELDDWFEGVDLAGLDGDPVVVDAQHHVPTLKAFEHALRDSKARLLRDDDGDGSFSAEELMPGRALAE